MTKNNNTEPTANDSLSSGSNSPHFKLESNLGSDNHPAKSLSAESFSAWEEVESGRYMPRRIRGSCTGRALG
jgi:hypothetical protein